MPQKSPWDGKPDEMLRKLHLGGASFSEIAAEINAACGTSFTRNAAIGRASRAGLANSAPRKSKVQQAAKPNVHRERIRYSPEQKRLVPIIETDAFQTMPRPDLDAMSLKLSILDLTKKTCKWPSGGDETPITFCGCSAAPGLSYCMPHQRISSPGICVSDEERKLRRLRGIRAARERNRERMVQHEAR